MELYSFFYLKLKFSFFAIKTKSAVLIAIYKGEGIAGAEVRGAVEKLAKFMEDAGY